VVAIRRRRRRNDRRPTVRPAPATFTPLRLTFLARVPVTGGATAWAANPLVLVVRRSTTLPSSRICTRQVVVKSRPRASNRLTTL
jgi:hypothetical protein